MAREADVFSIRTTYMSVLAGGASAYLMTPLPGEVGSIIKFVSGGSLEIFGVSTGITYTGTSLSSLPGKGYFLDISETINFEGPVRYYLVATGSPAVLSVLKGLSSGY